VSIGSCHETWWNCKWIFGRRRSC